MWCTLQAAAFSVSGRVESKASRACMDHVSISRWTMATGFFRYGSACMHACMNVYIHIHMHAAFQMHLLVE